VMACFCLHLSPCFWTRLMSTKRSSPFILVPCTTTKAKPT
jgi:hypothetical protein